MSWMSCQSCIPRSLSSQLAPLLSCQVTRSRCLSIPITLNKIHIEWCQRSTTQICHLQSKRDTKFKMWSDFHVMTERLPILPYAKTSSSIVLIQTSDLDFKFKEQERCWLLIQLVKNSWVKQHTNLMVILFHSIGIKLKNLFIHHQLRIVLLISTLNSKVRPSNCLMLNSQTKKVKRLIPDLNSNSKLVIDSTLNNQDATKVFSCHQLNQLVTSDAEEENAS